MFITIIIITMIIVLIIIVGTCCYFGYWMVHMPSECITTSPAKYGLDFEEICFKEIKDNLSLKGWWIPSQIGDKKTNSQYTIILSHGYHNVRSLEGINLLNLVKVLAHSDYNVLMFDFRHCGYSEGEVTTGGYKEKYDLLSAIHYAKKVKKSEHITVMGWSMGAAVSLFAGALSKDVEVIIADSPFSDLEECLNTAMPFYTKLPRFPFTVLTVAIVSRLLKIDLKELRTLEVLHELEGKPILLIHAKEDEIIPSKETEAIYEAIADKTKVELWIPNVKGHILSYKLQSKAYESHVLTFLQKYFRKEQSLNYKEPRDTINNS